MTAQIERPQGSRTLIHPDNAVACLQAIQEVHGDAEGLVHLWQVTSAGERLWKSWPIKRLEAGFLKSEWETVNGLPIDLYGRQHTFHTPWPKKRKNAWKSVRQIRTVSIDCDCQSMGTFPTAEAGAIAALEHLASLGLPSPNHVDFSGNGKQGGFHLRWLLEPLDAQDGLQRYRDYCLWQSAIKELVGRLEPVGGDHRATDVVRWLRLPGTVNSKYLDQGNGGPTYREVIHDRRIPLQALADALKLAKVERPPRRPEQPSVSRNLCDDNNARREALDKTWRVHPLGRNASVLNRLSGLRGGIREGHRTSALLFYGYCIRGACADRETFDAECQKLAAGFVPPLAPEELERTIQSAWEREPRKIRYRLLIDQLGITQAEQSALGIAPHPPKHDKDGNVIADHLPYHRERARQASTAYRRRKGRRPKAEANAATAKARSEKSKARIADAIAVLGPDASHAAIARLTRLSPKTVKAGRPGVYPQHPETPHGEIPSS